jgi:hypothetical protein
MSTLHQYQCHLAEFFYAVQDIPAVWLRILEDNSNTSNYLLSSLLGLKHDELYVTLMQKCGLIRLEPKTKGFIASINCIWNGLGSTWSDFFIEFNLDMEISHVYQDKKKVSFVCVGTFKEAAECFTIWDQI